jgi:pimeloyl-ACP methyl ester carboxylesterase
MSDFAIQVSDLSDALGFSMGGFIAQQFTMDRPGIVRARAQRGKPKT